MYNYAVLMHPGQNRVFFDSSKEMAIAELELASSRMDSCCENLGVRAIAGVDYLTFDSSFALSARDIDILSRLSSFFALFEIVEQNGAISLHPIAPSGFERFTVNIAGMLKYSGKTNESFTRMMMNAAIFSSGFDYADPAFKLLDPICGKGTTLFDGAHCGYNVYGVEVAEKVANEAAVFFRKFLETEKHKHSYNTQRLSGPNKSYTSNVYKFIHAPGKDEIKNPAISRELVIVGGNSKNADGYFGKNFAHVIVGDLPYGVVHGNVSGAQQSSKTRNPKELLKECLPAWGRVLKKGGVIALSWNVFLLPKDEIAHILQQNGFEVFAGGPYEKFEHRVDQAIKRDIIIAKKS